MTMNAHRVNEWVHVHQTHPQMPPDRPWPAVINKIYNMSVEVMATTVDEDIIEMKTCIGAISERSFKTRNALEAWQRAR